MSDNSAERGEHVLIKLNKEIGEMEDQGERATEYFKTHLSDQLIFRRANGTIADKHDFIEGLKADKRFKARVSDLVSVGIKGDRALITLMVVGTLKDDSVHYYRNVRLFARVGEDWKMELWFNYEVPCL